MHTADNDPAGSGELRPLRRPPYGLPPWPRRRFLAESDSLGWRTYSTPAPPESPRRRWVPHSLPRPALIAGLLICASIGIWSIGWGTDSAGSRSSAASTPTPTPSVVGRLVASTPLPTPSPRARPSTTSRPIPKASKSKVKLPRPHRRSAIPTVPRERHRNEAPAPSKKTVVPTDRARKNGNNDPRARDRKPEVAGLAAMCDERYPPSRPELRMHNWACHSILG